MNECETLVTYEALREAATATITLSLRMTGIKFLKIYGLFVMLL